AFFAHGFAKNEQSNISAQELIFFKSLASDTFALSEEKLNFLLNEQELRELKNE
ncbi:MAG: type II toxin-antitoxin system RelE/ParE family toxin, partial [Neisseriaceae bacterium]|nr:type II toxin-antitoxin system RelE/ParE family toxin [Neisseriaceae bacterium]MBR5941423.1 type II toxin-antitoxin system RelE/ParE family toxin [Neisseriaceae bacterium]